MYVLDTNVLIHNDKALETYPESIIPIVVLEELDKLKTVEGELGFKARRAIKKLYANEDLIYDFGDYTTRLPKGWDLDKPDNIIILSALANDAILVSNDINVIVKSEGIGIECIVDAQREEIYKGYRYLEGDTKFICELYEKLDDYKFLENEYLVLKDTSVDKVHEFRYNDGKLTHLVLPPKIKGLNPLQRCALDLMNDRNIPIKLILGGYGSGKTFLSVKVALQHLKEKGYYNKILCLRNPIGEGKEIGFLKGTKDDKTADFFKPIVDCLDGGHFELDDLVMKGQLERDIPYYIKGRTFNDTIILTDEAEDIQYKQLKLIGTRLGKNSCIYLVGDYKQSVYDVGRGNGLLKLADNLKGNPMVGIIHLEDDVRSEASKIFADLD